MLGRRLPTTHTMRALNEHRGKGAAGPAIRAGAHRERGRNWEADTGEGKSRAKAKGRGRDSGEQQSMGSFFIPN